MVDYLLPIGFCVLLWWAGTGVVLWLNTQQHSGRTVLVTSLCALLSVVVIALLSNSNTLWAVYLSFIATLVVWGWSEVMHYSGVLAGPGVEPCKPGLSTPRRFVVACHAVLYHEVLMVSIAALIWVLCTGGVNQTAFYTYLVLWLMRVSAELNVFLGVANLPEEWLPNKVRYLMSFRSVKPVNAFFPFSVAVASAVCIWLFMSLENAITNPVAATSQTLVATLLLLAIIEHWMLVIPMKGTALWAWVENRPKAAAAK